MSAFKKAQRLDAKLRMALTGPPGSGKTMTALKLANVLARGGPIAVIDSERGSAEKYAHGSGGSGGVADFDTLQLTTFAPLTYVAAIHEAARAAYPVLIIDSLSHAWNGKDGALEQVDKRAKHTNNSFGAWRDVTPMQQELIDTILGYPGHVIVTMRTKTEYAVEQNEKGKSSVKKLGLAPVQRDGVEYEFDVVGDMTADNDLLVSKTRCAALKENGGVYHQPGQALGQTLLDWLTGEPGVAERDVADLRARFAAAYGDEAPDKEEAICLWASGKMSRRLEDLDGQSRVKVIRGLEAHENKLAADAAANASSEASASSLTTDTDNDHA